MNFGEGSWSACTGLVCLLSGMLVACSAEDGGTAEDDPTSEEFAGAGSQPVEEEPKALILEAKSGAPVELPERALAMSSRVVTVDPLALDNERIELSLDGTKLIASQTSTQEIQNRRVWIGRVEGDPTTDNQVVLTASNGTVVGWVQHDGRLQEIEPLADGRHVLFETDASTLPECVDDPEQEELDEDHIAFDEAPVEEGDPEATTVVDALVVYTPRSRNRYGRSGIENKIINAIASANEAYRNSNVSIELRLAHMEEINYTESGGISTSLSRLRGTSDGYMDSVHSLRNAVGADMVALVSEDSGACGIASLMTNVSSSFQSRAFSVTASGCLSNHTLAHEFGHNMGSAHNRENAGSAAYSYSYGYRYCNNYRTVMAYSCSSPRQPYFSNPDVSFRSLPTGTSSADNARSLNNTKNTVSNWRDSVQPECSVDQDCADGNSCTTDRCNGGVCQSSFNTSSCDDGDSCTSGDRCSGGSCQGTPNGTCQCGPGEFAHNGHCYAALTTTRSYDDAQAACESRGAGWSLVKIDDAEENNFVEQLMSGDRWLGANDRQSEGTFRWEDGTVLWSGGPVSGAFASFLDGEPNNAGGSGAADCVRMLNNGNWRDYDCAGLFGAVCESGGAVGECVSAADCDDGNECTVNTCDGGTCNTQNASGSCSLDGDPCTDDVCQGGVCTHPDNGTCECVSDSDCDDGNECTDDACENQACVNTNHQRTCTGDGNSCTDDVCSAGVCTHPDNGSCGGGGELSGSVTIRSDWESGYCADVTIDNDTSSRIDGWSVVVDLNGAQLDGAWNVTVSSGSDSFSATNVSWNGTVQAGQSLEAFGFCAAKTASSGAPSLISVVER